MKNPALRYEGGIYFHWNRYISNYNCGPEGINALAASLSQYCLKFSIYMAANFLAFSFPLRFVGIRIARIENTFRNIVQFFGSCQVHDRNMNFSASSIEPSMMASMIARLSLMEIRFPQSFQPVFTSQLSVSLHFFDQTLCVDRGMKRKESFSPNAGGEKDGTGSVIPRFAPASLRWNRKGSDIELDYRRELKPEEELRMHRPTDKLPCWRVPHVKEEQFCW